MKKIIYLHKKMFFPDYPWFLIKEFLFRKSHPVAKLLKTFSERYQRPQIFMSMYYKLNNGMFVKVPRHVLQIDPPLANTSITFFQYVRIKTFPKKKTKLKDMTFY
jgi:hypothetical protein